MLLLLLSAENTARSKRPWFSVAFGPGRCVVIFCVVIFTSYSCRRRAIISLGCFSGASPELSLAN